MLVAFGLAAATRVAPRTTEAAALGAPALPADAGALLIGAADARRRGDLRAALHLLRDAVARAPGTDTHAALGAFYLELGAAGAAADQLRSAVEGDPGNPARWTALAEALALRPDPVGAAAAHARAAAAAHGGDAAIVAAGSSAACAGGGCTEYLGRGSKRSYFRIVVPDAWDGDLFLVNHGLELDPLTIAPHHTCKGDPTRPCSTNADCAGVGPQVCFEISLLGFDEILLPKGKAVGASTFSQITWSAFQSRVDLKDMIRFMTRKGPGRPKRIIVTGFSGGGAVTVDATMRLRPGKQIHGAIPLCSASAGGTPTVDAATDFRLVYDYLCRDVPGGSFSSLPDVGGPTLSQIEFGLMVNTCLGWLAPSADPAEAAAQRARLDAMFALTRIPGPNFNIVHVLGFSVLAMGDFVLDPERLNGRRPGWNRDIDYAPFAGPDFDAWVPRFGPGRGREKMARNPWIDFTRGRGRRVDYPILSFAGRGDHICPPEFQKVYDDAAALGGKDHAIIWGSTGGHCVFTPLELRAVVEEYLEWLDSYQTAQPDEPTTADVLARCLSLPGGSAAQCNFDPAFTPGALVDRVAPRADWPEAAKHPL